MKPLAVFDSRWPELSALLDEALALPESARDPWLAALKLETAEMHASLRALLAAHVQAETEDFLGTMVPPQMPTADAGAMPAAGDAVGPYRLLQPLGEGGMGSVWLAERADGTLKRKVALKLPRLVWGDALLQRMARERDILAALEHPNIARLYDAGVDTLGRPWLALEHVQGRPIDVHARELGLDARARLHLLLQVCDAVAFAHARLVIHRDLKPSNILVNADGEVKLLDFGIAKLVQGERTEATALTQHVGVAMTPDYASPEQIRGEPLGTASDVYSLGVVAFELLAGERPYALRRGSAAELEVAMAGLDAPRASALASTPALKKTLRGDLDAILNKALKKDTAERYPTVSSLADDLQRHLRGEVVLARPDSRAYRMRRFVARHRVGVGALGAVVAALGVGLGVALWQAEQARESASRESVIQEMYLETLSAVAAMDPATFAKGGSVARELRAKLEDFDKRNQAEPGRRMALWQTVTAQLPYLGDDAGALDTGRRYLALLKQAKAPGARQFEAYWMISLALVQLGRTAEAEELLRQALAEHPAAAAYRDERSSVVVELAKLIGRLGRVAEAQRLLEDSGLQFADLDFHKRWEVLIARARLSMGYDDAAALRLARQARDGYGREALAYPNNLANGALWLGIAALHNMLPAEAEVAAREAGRRYESLAGPADRDSILAVGVVSAALTMQGRFDEARKLLRQREADVDARPGEYAPEHRAMLAARRLEIEVAHGDAGAALALATLRSKDAPLLLRNPELSVYVRAQARALIWNGRADDAVRETRAWIEALPPERRNLPAAMQMRVALAEAELESGRAATALQQLNELRVVMREQRATGTWLYREAGSWAALAQARLGDLSGGRAPAESIAAAGDAPPPSAPTWRADALLRTARLQQLAGREADRAAVAEMPSLLATQHPESPRWTAARTMIAATASSGRVGSPAAASVAASAAQAR